MKVATILRLFRIWWEGSRPTRLHPINAVLFFFWNVPHLDEDRIKTHVLRNFSFDLVTKIHNSRDFY
jgi:hypothetical protein